MLAYLVMPVMLLCQNSVAVTPPTDDNNALAVSLSTEIWPGFTEPDQRGAYFELISLVYQPWRLNLKVKFTNFNRALSLVRQQKSDMTLAVSAHDAAELLLSARPIDEDKIVAIYHPQHQKINSIADLTSLRLAWNLAYDFGNILGLNATGYEVPSVAQGVELVLKQRIDVYLSELSQYEYFLQQHPDLPLQALPVASDPIFAAFAATPKGEQLKCLWDQRVQALTDSGELQQLYQRYNDFILLTKPP